MRLIELLTQCKDNKFRPQCIPVNDIIEICAESLSANQCRIRLRKHRRWLTVNEPYAELIARLEVQRI